MKPQKRYDRLTMQIDIYTKNVELNPALRTFVEEKIGDLGHLLGNVGPVHAHVEVGLPSQHHQKGAVYYAEVNLDLNGQMLRAESTNFDLHAAIVDVKDDLKVQIAKYKERMQDAQRHPEEA
jgi:ribosomal subunit interface protein